jgi:hypothetical protein
MKKNILIISLFIVTACTSKKTKSAKESTVTKTDSVQKKNPDFSSVTAEVDTDKDGKMTTAEWKAAGLPESSFKGFEKGRGYVTQDDYANNPAPDGIDINGDGKLTVAEFKEFDKIMSEKMKKGEMPPPPK